MIKIYYIEKFTDERNFLEIMKDTAKIAVETLVNNLHKDKNIDKFIKMFLNEYKTVEYFIDAFKERYEELSKDSLFRLAYNKLYEFLEKEKNENLLGEGI